MKKFRGTKGSWITFMNDVTKEYSIGGGNDERYFIAKIHSTGRDTETCRANTNLIATAPELLDVCKSLHKRLIEYIESSHNVINGSTIDLLNAEKIIEKATKCS